MQLLAQARPTMQCILLVRIMQFCTNTHRNAQGSIIVGASLRNWLALFPGSHTPECKHWSCTGVESLVFFLTWEAVNVERRHLNCVWAYPRFRTRKRGKVAGHLLHVSSYRRSNITHTARWTHSWLNNAQSITFLFIPILITSCLHRKDTRFSLWCIFAFQESLGTGLPPDHSITIFTQVVHLARGNWDECSK